MIFCARRGRAFADAEGQEHAHRLLEHLRVAAHLIAEDVERRIRAERVGHLTAQLFLIADQGIDGEIEERRDEILDGIAVEADELAKEGDGQQILAALALLLEDDLGQNRAGDVLAGLGVGDDEILALLQHLGEILERDIGRGAGVVETPVRVLLDGGRRLLLRHALAGTKVPLPEPAGRGHPYAKPVNDKGFLRSPPIYCAMLQELVAMQRSPGGTIDRRGAAGL